LRASPFSTVQASSASKKVATMTPTTAATLAAIMADIWLDAWLACWGLKAHRRPGAIAVQMTAQQQRAMHVIPL